VYVLASPLSPKLLAKTWYIRPDGGTRYSANMTNGQCDGKSDVPYSGSGVNQHCAFREFRYLYDDDSGVTRYDSGMVWVISGGDTVIVRGCSASTDQTNPSNPNCRIGWDRGWGGTGNNWCYYLNNGSYGCYNPPIPSGTATQHTRILGQNYANCNVGGSTDPKQYASNLTQLFGGFGVSYTLNLQNTQYVDIQCLEITTHNGKCNYGVGQAFSGGPPPCSSNQPVDDFAMNGLLFNNNSSTINLQDVYIHGFNSSGLYGPIGGPIHMTRVNASFNAFAGWNFDDGSDTPDASGSQILASYVTMIGNGCYEEYPVTHAFPARACYDSSSGGFGDAWSGQDTQLDVFHCDHCVMMYNTKDAFIGPHTQIADLSITNSISIGNMGAQWKWGNTQNAVSLFQNNLTVMNCHRMAEQLPGAPQNFNISTGNAGAYLSNFCRAAGNGFSLNTRSGSTNKFYGNTVIAANATIVFMDCGYYAPGNALHEETNCGSVPNIWEDNLFLAYTDPAINNGAPGLWYANPGSNIAFTSSHNLEYGVRNGDSCGTNGTTCLDPQLAKEPLQSWINETALDVFSLSNGGFRPSNSSPAIGSGTPLNGLTADYYGVARPFTPTLGAIEP